MSDQPETMLEYHFQKLGRHVLVMAGFLMAAVFATGSAIVLQNDPVIGLLLSLTAAVMVVITHAMGINGLPRRFLNWAFRVELSDLERPDSGGSSEVVADD